MFDIPLHAIKRSESSVSSGCFRKCESTSKFHRTPEAQTPPLSNTLCGSRESEYCVAALS